MPWPPFLRHGLDSIVKPFYSLRSHGSLACYLKTFFVCFAIYCNWFNLKTTTPYRCEFVIIHFLFNASYEGHELTSIGKKRNMSHGDLNWWPFKCWEVFPLIFAFSNLKMGALADILKEWCVDPPDTSTCMCQLLYIKIPSEMEVAPRYNCWNCWHCWHYSTLLTWRIMSNHFIHICPVPIFQ